MFTLTAKAVLDVWERGAAQTSAQRALTVLAGFGIHSREVLGALSITERDALLLEVRQALFGATLCGLAVCPACGDRCELECDVAQISPKKSPDVPTVLELTAEGYHIAFRLPLAADLAALSHVADKEDGRRRLLEACVVEARREGERIPPADLPQALAQSIEDRMEVAEPDVDLRLALTCPRCAHPWHQPLDVMAFLWRELQGLASRLLREVHLLAAAYSWSETDILEMSARRRQAYLELLGA